MVHPLQLNTGEYILVQLSTEEDNHNLQVSTGEYRWVQLSTFGTGEYN